MRAAPGGGGPRHGSRSRLRVLWIDTSTSVSAHASECNDDDDDDDFSRLAHTSQRCFARVLESTTTDAVRSDKKLSTNSGGIGRFEEG